MHAERYCGRQAVAQLISGLSPSAGLCWLDGGDGSYGGYSFLGLEPVATVLRDGRDPNPLAAFAELEDAERLDPHVTGDAEVDCPDPGQVPRWAGYVAYEAHFAYSRRRPIGHARPVLCFRRYDAWLVLDHSTGARMLIGDDPAACARLRRRIDSAPAPAAVHEGVATRTGPLRVSHGEQHLTAVERALQHIAAGDIYQVNLARRYEAPIEGRPIDLALAMRAQGEVPYGMVFDDGTQLLVGRSMECFLRWDRTTGQLRTSPIKGTVARDGERDASDAEQLLNDPKERAEHAMIVDLMRNDLGRIAEPGTVRVADLMRVEPYARLSHLVSTVHCRARAKLALPELLEATFPPGSITGTPKLRALEIIDALEHSPRGIYTGAYGFVDRLGGCSLAVAIRTATIDHGLAQYHAGGGIVEASEPARELAETELKAAGFVAALAALEHPQSPLRTRAPDTPPKRV